FVARVKFAAAVLLAAVVVAAGAVFAIRQAVAAKLGNETQPFAEGRKDPQAKPEGKLTRTDLYGDPLPPGAVARLGSVQLRHQGLTDLVFLADNKTLVSSGWNREIRFWDAATGKLVRITQLQETGGPGRGLALSPDGKTVACWDNGKLYFWNVTTGKEIKSIPCSRTEDSFGCNFSPDGRILAVGVDFAKIALWDWQNEKSLHLVLPLKVNPASLDSSYHTCFSPDGKLLATGAGGQQPLCFWDVTTGKEVRRIDDQPICSAFSPDGKLLALASQPEGEGNGTALHIWEVATGKLVLKVPPLGKKYCWGIDFSPDGNTIALTDLETIYLVDSRTGRQLRRMHGQARTVLFSRDGRWLAGNAGNRIRFWEVATGKELHDRPGNGYPASDLVYRPDGRLLATATGSDPFIALWEPASGRHVRPLEFTSENRYVRSLTLFDDGQTLIAGLSDGLLLYLDVATGTVRRTVRVKDLNQPYSSFLAYQLSPNGRHVASLGPASPPGYAFQLRLWETDSGKLVRSDIFSAHQPRVWKSLGMKWALHMVDGLAIVDGISGQIQVRVPGAWIPPLATSPDNRLLAGRINSGKPPQPDPKGEGQAIRVCETATGQEVLTLETGSVEFLALAPDNRTLVTADTAYLRLWDLATGKELHRLAFPKEFAVRSNVKFLQGLYLSPDGHRATTALADGTLLVWDLTLPSRREGLVVKPPDSKELEGLWNELADQNASKGFAAIWKLTDMPEQAVVLFRKKLKPVVAEDFKNAAQLIRELDSDIFTVREAASEDLKKMGRALAPELREALATKPSLDVRRRLETILAAISNSVPTPEVFRHLRAIQVLEQISSREAREVLESLAKGIPEALETQEAKASLGRLGK
ncbi:MAG TPA: hypothetical protein VGY77_10520, partial [Gemmataceae bacterium]|nr:hypothetical protein [Gemmataceae bacterium]